MAQLQNEFDAIKERRNQARQEYYNGFSNRSDEIQALGSNLVTINDIDKCRDKVAGEMERVHKRMIELRNENPYFSPNTHQEYKELADKFDRLEGMRSNLNTYEAELDTDNYLMCQELNAKNTDKADDIPYLQQMDKYNYLNLGSETLDFNNQHRLKLDGLEQHVNDIDAKLESSSTQPIDKFQMDFQRSRIEKELGYIKEYGSEGEQKRAEELLRRFDETHKKLAQEYKDYHLYSDGTIQKVSEKEHGGIKLINDKTTESPNLDNDNTETIKKREVVLWGGETVTKVEKMLYTGHDTGKASKEFRYDTFKSRLEIIKTKTDAEGKKIKDTTTSEFDLGHIEAKSEMDLNKGKISFDASTSLAKAKAEHSHTEGEKTTTKSVETNVGKTHFAAEYDKKQLAVSAEASVSALEANAKVELEGHGHKTEFTAEGSLFGASAKGGMDKFGINGKAEVHKIDGDISISQDDVKVASVSDLFNIKAKDLREVSYAPHGNLKDAFEGMETGEELHTTAKDNEKYYEAEKQKWEVKNPSVFQEKDKKDDSDADDTSRTGKWDIFKGNEDHPDGKVVFSENILIKPSNNKSGELLDFYQYCTNKGYDFHEPGLNFVLTDPTAAEKLKKAYPDIFIPSPIEKTKDIKTIENSIKEVNPNYNSFIAKIIRHTPYANNCGSCSLATFLRLSDIDSKAVATKYNIETNSAMSHQLSNIPIQVDSVNNTNYTEIENRLKAMGNGSYCIVGIDRVGVNEPGHWFCAYYDGKKVHAIDGQNGTVRDWPPDYGDIENWDAIYPRTVATYKF